MDVIIRDGEKISVTAFDFLKFSKQLTARRLCVNFKKSQKKAVPFISVKLLKFTPTFDKLGGLKKSMLTFTLHLNGTFGKSTGIFYPN
jgi:hypothetical protein